MLARQGDQTAYKKLLIQIAPVVRRTIAARLRGWEQQRDTEDITQETLLAVHLKLHTYDAKLDFLPWLRTVARYKTIDFQRRNRYAPTVSIDDEHVPELEDAASRQDMTASRDLDKLLSQLKPPAGEIIRALKVEGTSVRELAATYKVSESSIKVIVHRGLQKLSQLVRTERMSAS
jgi:RNA polymerase sigma-70 factor (ECF subfamily)